MNISPSAGQEAAKELREPAWVGALLCFAVSALLAAPCLWQEHIQAGDLSSHLYNAWLAERVQRGEVAGLFLTHPVTNVLSDYLFETLMTNLGALAAERIVCVISVLTFFWGAFYFIAKVNRRQPWIMAPVLAILAYGLVFQMGFTNHYLSTGLSLIGMALLWPPRIARGLLAIPFFLLAFLAHLIPLVWALAVLTYVYLFRKVPEGLEYAAIILAWLSVALVSTSLPLAIPVTWSLSELTSAQGVLGLAGAQQVWLYGTKYLIVVGAVLALWISLLLERIDKGGFLSDPAVHIWLLSCGMFVAMPSAIQLPQYQFKLGYIPERLSLFTALSLCLVAAKGRHGRGITRLAVLTAAVFFSFLFADSRAFNRVEHEVEDLVVMLPPGQRVVASITDSNSRLFPMAHVVDRACIGRCYSYGNYEPASGAFRVHVKGPSPGAAATGQAVSEIAAGTHVVTKEEAPTYAICGCASGSRFCLRVLKAGETTCTVSVAIAPPLWGENPLNWLPSPLQNRSGGY